MPCSPKSLVLPGLLAIAVLSHSGNLLAEDPKPEAGPASPPQVIMVLPPVIVPDAKPQKLKVRGLNLDGATSVTLQAPGNEPLQLEIKKQRKVGLGNGQTAEKVGDAELEFEFTLPESANGEALELVATNAKGKSSPRAVYIATKDALLRDQGSNDGFQSAQAVELSDAPKLVSGSIQQQRDVDVFALKLDAGTTLNAELQAAALGSPMDGLLMLFDEQGQLLATVDDVAADGKISSDPKLQFEVPHGGIYYLSVLDAQDMGDGLSVYLLRLAVER